MNLLTLRMHEGGAVYTIVDDETIEKIQAFDAVKRKHHIISNFEYVHADDRRNYALDLLGLPKDPTEAIIGDNVIVVFKNKMIDLPENFSQCKRMYVL